MGMVTAETIEIARIPTEMGFFHRLLGLMTPQAQATAGVLEQTIVAAAVRIVTNPAAPFLEGLVGARIGFFQFVVATETEILLRLGQQASHGRGVGGMTPAAVSLLYRLMQNRAGAHAILRLFMTTVTKFALFLDQQPLMAPDMGRVTLLAVVFRHRSVHHLALEIGALVAVEAGRSQAGGGPGRDDAKTKRENNQWDDSLSFHY